MKRRTFLCSSTSFLACGVLGALLGHRSGGDKKLEYFSGGCQRCHEPLYLGDNVGWQVWHTTMFERQRGIMALCERCWVALTPQERLPFYRAVYENPRGGWDSYADWQEIEASVLHEPRFGNWF